MHVTGYHNIFTKFSVSSSLYACGQTLKLVPTVYFLSICVILILILLCAFAYVCLSYCVFILGSVVDFIHTWNELHNMLMTLPSFGSPVWVLDVRLYATFNYRTISVSFVRTTTTYYDLGDLYGIWCMLEVYVVVCM